jgi:hypothetical protein
VYIKDKNGVTKYTYDGTKAAFWVIVAGDTITSNLVTDGSVTAYGYTIDQVAYFSTNPLATDAKTTFTDPVIGK